jgi:ABC-2 type transport system ATP-binding protein
LSTHYLGAFKAAPLAKAWQVRELVDLAAAEGTTIFFSSHQIADVEQIAARVSIVDNGISLLAEKLDDMKDRYQRIQVHGKA